MNRIVAKICKWAMGKSVQEFGLKELAEVNRKAISSAGPRYFLNLDSNFPDVNIGSFDEAIVGLLGGDDLRDFITDIKQGLKEGWGNLCVNLQDDYQDKRSGPQDILSALDELGDSAPGAGDKAIAKICRRVGREREKIAALQHEIYEKSKEQPKEGGHYSRLRPDRGITPYKHALERVIDFVPGYDRSYITGKPCNLRAKACELHQNGTLILHSEWGMGKTHSLCSLAKKQEKRGMPVLLVLAKDLNLHADALPGDVIARHTGLAGDFDGLLRRLNELGRDSNVRALLLVDGINERNPDGLWGQKLAEMLQKVRRYPFVGLVVSFRTPFSHGLSESDLLKTPVLRHDGFNEIPIEAQGAFLRYYKVPLPEVPPMAEEFTRPLTLKIICENFKSLPAKEQRKGFDGIASGQKGMTRILERYIKTRAKAVAKKYPELSATKVWSLLDEEMAPYMAENLTEEAPARLLLKAMRDRFSINALEGRKVLYDMRREGVIIMRQGMPIDPAAPTEKAQKHMSLVQMPYQRFGDHLVARELMKQHLKTESVSKVRRSFYANNPLGQVFAPRGHRKAGLIEALIIEFPERIKSTPGISSEKRELLFYLPYWKKKSGAYRDPFLDGLYWRTRGAFSHQTEKLLGGYLQNWKNAVMRDAKGYYTFGDNSVIATLLTLACRHASPIPAKRLYKWIKPMAMPDRDILWGAATQDVRKNGWTHRLFSWLSAIEDNEFKGVSAETACNYVILLSLFLGSTDRPLRDKATRALVIIGEYFPSELFAHTMDTLDFNDIYYPERMLAACYGVAMSSWSNPDAKNFHNAFPEFAHNVIKDVFMPGGRLLTHHALVRDYALGIAEIARRLGLKIDTDQEAYMKPPFSAIPFPFKGATAIDDKDLADVDFALRMDFKDYTIGALVSSRMGHDDSDPGYVETLRRIKFRMRQLGCTKDKFMERDGRLAQGHYRHRRGKIDRYGKKYSWIAYFEMYGWLFANRQDVPEDRDPRRPNTGIIDPTFPASSRKWNFDFKPLSMHNNNHRWIKHGNPPDYSHILEMHKLENNWVMLEGYSTHINKHKNRKMDSLLRGLFVQEDNIPALREELERNNNLGFSFEIDKGYYIFAGEIPSLPNFEKTQNSKYEKKAFDVVPIETAVFVHEWESHHSEENQPSGVYFPAPDMCASLKLSWRGRRVNLCDEYGQLASVYHSDANVSESDAGPIHNEFQFLHIRKDLLDKYLCNTNKRLVWVFWVDRFLLAERVSYVPSHIDKQLIVYDPTAMNKAGANCRGWRTLLGRF